MGWRTVADVRDHSSARGSTYTVALMLAERAPDETRVARPGLDQLAKDSRVSRSTAQRALTWLEERGEIEAVANRQGGRGRATEWAIRVGEGAQDDTLSGEPERVSSTPERVSSTSLKGVTHDTPTKGNRREPISHPPPPPPDQLGVDELFSDYCRVLGKRNPGRAPAPDERRILNDALRVAEPEEVRACFRACAASDYHMKRGRHKGRKGGRYNGLGTILKPRPRRGETQRSRIEFWLELAEEQAGPKPRRRYVHPDQREEQT